MCVCVCVGGGGGGCTAPHTRIPPRAVLFYTVLHVLTIRMYRDVSLTLYPGGRGGGRLR